MESEVSEVSNGKGSYLHGIEYRLRLHMTHLLKQFYL